MHIVFLTNILNPYRRRFFDELDKIFKKKNIKFTVLVMTDTEPERPWNYSQFKTEYTTLLPHKKMHISKYFIVYNPNLKKYLKDLNPDVVIAGGSYILPSVWDAIKQKRKLNYKLFFWSESHLGEARNFSKVKLRFRDEVRTYIYKKFDGFLYAGELSLDFIKKYEKENSIHLFTPNLIDNKLFSTAFTKDENLKKMINNKYSIDKNKYVFICPARLNPVKGLDKFISLISKSDNKNKLTIIIAGTGDEEQKLTELIEKLNVDVRLVGHKSEEEIIDLYSIADCFLLPSLSDPNPLSCIEALWAGLPLLVSKHVGNHPEVVFPGENGYVFSYEEEKAAIEMIDALITSNKEWNLSARTRSREIANRIYNTEIATKNLVNNILKLIQEN